MAAALTQGNGDRARGRPQVYWPLAALCAAGVALRLLVMLTYSSAVFVFQNGDSVRYARIPISGPTPGIFSDPTAPAGYPIFLKLLRDLWSAIDFTVAIQHLIGVLVALLLYAIARRLGVTRGVALVPAAVVLLSGDQLFLEQALLTETLWGLVLTGAVYALIRGTERARLDPRWLLVAGALIAGGTMIRQIAVVLVPVAGVWLAIVVPGRAARRLAAASATVGAAVVVLLLYVGVAHLEHGSAALGDQGGYQLYGRVAEFADCSDFTPPGRTRLLCQTIPPSQRPGPTAYLFSPGSPLISRFHVRLPRDDGLLRKFAIDAIVNQPFAYISTVLADWERAAGLRHERIGEGAAPSDMRFSRTVPYGAPAGAYTAQAVAAYYQRVYTGIRVLPLPHWAHRLGRYQSVVRLHEVFVLPLLLIALSGAIIRPGPGRRGIVLLLGFALALYMSPAIVALWDVRYGIFPGELLATAAAVGAWELYGARRGAVRRPTPLTS